tara:strand:- start:895 stop:1089 length:195 start_codon:yes stop_codon:yes gene_type:complete
MKWEENIELRDLVVRLKNSAKDKEFFMKFISQVANDETFAKTLTHAIDSELQDRQWRKEHGNNV